MRRYVLAVHGSRTGDESKQVQFLQLVDRIACSVCPHSCAKSTGRHTYRVSDLKTPLPDVAKSCESADDVI